MRTVAGCSSATARGGEPHASAHHIAEIMSAITCPARMLWRSSFDMILRSEIAQPRCFGRLISKISHCKSVSSMIQPRPHAYSCMSLHAAVPGTTRVPYLRMGHMSTIKCRLAVFMMVVAAAVPASAGTLTLVNSRALLQPGDSIDWGDLGGDLTDLGATFSATSAAGSLTAAVSGATRFALFSGATFNADFAPGDTVLSLFDLTSGDPTSGVIRLLFSRPVIGAGAQIQSNFQGDFTASLAA